MDNLKHGLEAGVAVTKEATVPEVSFKGPRIVVMGVGGAGGNAVNNAIRKTAQELDNVLFLSCNTDQQALNHSLCSQNNRLQLGFEITKGLGAGACPEVGEEAAKASLDEVMHRLEGAHMLFLTAGMGGGTGTGASSIIAAAARAKGILTIGVVTKPFFFEGAKRMKSAERGIEQLRTSVDTLLVIPNQNLFCLAQEDTSFEEAFRKADDVLYNGMDMIISLMTRPGLINLDFADVGTVMRNSKGKAMMGSGKSSGENRALDAAKEALSCMLLDDVSIAGAKKVLVNVIGNTDLRLSEVDEALNYIKKQIDGEVEKGEDDGANIIFGATFDASLEKGFLRISVVATDIDRTTIVPAAEKAASVAQEAVSFDDFPEPSELDALSGASPGSGTLGSRHGDFDMGYNHFSSFSLQEDEAPYDYSVASSDVPVKEEKPVRKSLFQKLGFGRKAAVPESYEAPEEKSSFAEQRFSLKDTSVSEEDLTIPAFLRQKSDNKKK
jgi:cell division protein FtsZ